MERRFADTRFGKFSYLYRHGEFPLIALHGLGSSAESFAKTEKYISKRFELYYLDLLGHGESPKPEIEYTIENQILAINDFINNLELNSFVLMGNSYGGWVSLRYSLKFYLPEYLILVDSAGLQFDAGSITEESINKFIEYLVELNNKNNTKVLKNIIMNNYKSSLRLTPEELEKITSKTIIVWGNSDNVIDKKYAELFSGYIKNSKLIYMNSGHMPQLERPEEFAKIINENVI